MTRSGRSLNLNLPIPGLWFFPDCGSSSFFISQESGKRTATFGHLDGFQSSHAKDAVFFCGRRHNFDIMLIVKFDVF